MKKCCTCKRTLPASAFNRNIGKGSLDGLQNQCRSCQREAKLKHRYGITSGDYSSMADAQGHRCLICQTHASERPLVVDHDHATGKVRGLLCNKCNVLLGKAEDDVEILQAAIEYLRVKR